MNNSQKYQIDSDGAIIKYEVLLPETESDERLLCELSASEEQIDEQLQKIDEVIDGKSELIDKYTNNADALYYAIAASSGVIAGVLDIVFVGSFDFDAAKTSVDKAFDKFVHERAKEIKITEEIDKYKKKMAEKGLPIDKQRITQIKSNVENHFKTQKKSSSIKILEDYFGLPSDSIWSSKDGITPKSHHLDDFSHHPTVIGLASSILTQFTKTATFSNTLGIRIVYSIEDSELIGDGLKEKIIAGTINWLGHLISDMAGSRGSAAKGNLGMGLPGPVLSLIKELSSLPILKETQLPKLVNYLFTNDNAIFGKYRMDLRSELAIGKELTKQAIPIFTNEILVRSFYFLRELLTCARAAYNLRDIPWQSIVPIGNRTIERMMTISVGTMEAFDITEAAIQGAIAAEKASIAGATVGSVGGPVGTAGGASSAGTVAFFKTFALRINYVGITRLVLAGFIDTSMGIKRGKLINERISLYNEKLKLTNAKVLVSEAEMWISAEDAGIAILDAYSEISKAQEIFKEAYEDIDNSLNSIGRSVECIKQVNPGLPESMISVLTGDVPMENELINFSSIKSIDAEKVPQYIESQMMLLAEIKKRVNSAVEKAYSVKKTVVNHVGGKPTGTKKSIENLNQASIDIANAQIDAMTAQTVSFEYQQKLGEITKSLFCLGVSNIAANRAVVKELKLKLQEASEEELDDVARAEIEGLLNQLRAQEDVEIKQRELNDKVIKQQQQIDKLESQLLELQRQINELSKQN